VPTIPLGDLTPAGQRAITDPVSQCPLPRLPLKITAHASLATGLLTVRAQPTKTLPRTLRLPVTAISGHCFLIKLVCRRLVRAIAMTLR
jgi:hypothetical protein